MRLTKYQGWIPAIALLLLTACEPRQLYLGSRTVVGIHAAVNPEQMTGSLIVGYDRAFATVIPRSVQGGAAEERDAMSALVCSELAVEGITLRRYTESIATGPAAATFARRLRETDNSQIRDFFDCFKTQQPAQVGSGS